ncbi:MAG: hypothetical protein ABIU09_06270 [Pyrinomonadaceae bacterium]
MKRKTFYWRALLTVCIAFGVGLFTSTSYAQVEGGAIAAIDEPAEGGGSADIKKYNSRAKTAVTEKKARTAASRARTVAATATPGKWDGFIIGDKYSFLNFEVVSAAKPYHTRAAKAGGASGLVQVEILIGTNGSVLTARARTGNKLLHPEAERAALESKFNRPQVYGKPARAIGFLVYRFGAGEEE